MNEQREQIASKPTPRPFQFGIKVLLALPITVAAFFAVATWWGLTPAILFLSAVLIAVGLAYRATRVLAAVYVVVWVAFLIDVLPQVNGSRPGNRACCMNNLKNLALALHAYREDQGCFPPAYIADENGQPMHSWRVLILPYLEHQTIYDQYDFSEPWDGPNNSKLATQLFWPFYHCPAEGRGLRLTTNYVAVTGPDTVWPGSQSMSLDDFGQDWSQTILLIEVTNSNIHWMEPRDLQLSEITFKVNPKKGQGISSPHTGSRFPHRPAGASAAFLDGTVRFLPETTSPQELRAMLTRSVGEPAN